MNAVIKTQLGTGSTLASSTESTLYQLAFSGGPWDGNSQPSAALPPDCLQIRSGPPDCCTRRGGRLEPRLAEYRLAGVTLVAGGTPRVTCHFQYQGTADAARRKHHGPAGCARALMRRLVSGVIAVAHYFRFRSPCCVQG